MRARRYVHEAYRGRFTNLSFPRVSSQARVPLKSFLLSFTLPEVGTLYLPSSFISLVVLLQVKTLLSFANTNHYKAQK